MRWFTRVLKRGFKGAIQTYQWWLSPLMGPQCRFYPTCSHYALLCLDLYPFPQAVLKMGTRLARCHPWHPGGVDQP